ncbi:MAG: flavin reductase family protein [Candidatus Heimdallarchaeaceae archaeon]
MKKIQTIPSSSLYPNPVLLISSSHRGKESIITIAWAGTVSSDPPYVCIGIRKERFSYDLITKSKEFVVNIPTFDMLREIEICGTKSGKDIDKWKECNFTKGESTKIEVPYINECPVNMECRVERVLELGTHDLIIGKVLALHITEEWKERGYPNMVTYTRGKYKKCV